MKLILSAAIMSLISSSAFAVLLTTPTDPILGVQLVTTDGVTTISVATENGTAANRFPSGEAPRFAIDQNNTTKYLNFAKTNTGILVDAANDLLPLTSIELITGNDTPGRDPASFSIYGTNNSQSTTFSDYTAIVLNQPILTTDPGRRASSGVVSFTNLVAYDSYLVIFPTVRDPLPAGDPSGANSMQVSEIKLEGVPEPTTLGLLGLTTVGIAAMRRRRR